MLHIEKRLGGHTYNSLFPQKTMIPLTSTTISIFFCTTTISRLNARHTSSSLIFLTVLKGLYLLDSFKIWLTR